MEYDNNMQYPPFCQNFNMTEQDIKDIKLTPSRSPNDVLTKICINIQATFITNHLGKKIFRGKQRDQCLNSQ